MRPEESGRPPSSSCCTSCTSKPRRAPSCFQKLRRAQPLLPEMEIGAHHHAANAEPPDENIGDKRFGRNIGECGVEAHHHRAVEPRAGEQPQLRRLGRQPEQGLVRPEEHPRMRLEGERQRRRAESARPRSRRIDHRAMAAMHAIEVADRDEAALEPRRHRVAVTNYRKGGRNRRGNGHGTKVREAAHRMQRP